MYRSDRSINTDTTLLKIFPSFIYLSHELVVCFWYVVEGKDTKAKLE